MSARGEKPMAVDSAARGRVVVKGAVAHQVAGPERLHRKAHGDVRLGDAGRPEDQRADAVLDEAQLAQLGQALGVNLRLKDAHEQGPPQLKRRRSAQVYDRGA